MGVASGPWSRDVEVHCIGCWQLVLVLLLGSLLTLVFFNNFIHYYSLRGDLLCHYSLSFNFLSFMTWCYYFCTHRINWQNKCREVTTGIQAVHQHQCHYISVYLWWEFDWLQWWRAFRTLGRKKLYPQIILLIPFSWEKPLICVFGLSYDCLWGL